MNPNLRTPAVAGRFYPANADELLRGVRKYLSADYADDDGASTRSTAIGCVAPHAGYIYSGGVAGVVYQQLDIPKTCVILCPNHTGKGHPLAIMANTTWRTPLGDVSPDKDLTEELLRRFPALREDAAAHRSEHAIEVQIPFLQTLQRDLRIVPIVIGTRDFDVLHDLGSALADTIVNRERTNTNEEREQRVLIIASSDMNHYEPDVITRAKDHKAIERILALDPRGLWDVVINEKISMCGMGPTVAMLTAARVLCAKSGSLVKYATSGEVSGDFESVVGYAGMIVK